MAIDDVYQVQIFSTQAGQTYMNGLAFIRTLAADVTPANLLTLANEMKEIHRPSQVTGYNYTTFQARQVRGDAVEYPSGTDCQPVGGLFFDGALTGTLGGVAGGDHLPQQCAMVTTLRTGQIGRRKRGRWYAGGFGEAQQANGNFVGSDVSTVSAAWLLFLTAHAPIAPVDGWKLGVWSVREATGCEPDPVTGKHVRVDPPNPDDAFTPVIQHITRTPVFTQRRRRIGVGM